MKPLEEHTAENIENDVSTRVDPSKLYDLIGLLIQALPPNSQVHLAAPFLMNQCEEVRRLSAEAVVLKKELGGARLDDQFQQENFQHRLTETPPPSTEELSQMYTDTEELSLKQHGATKRYHGHMVLLTMAQNKLQSDLAALTVALEKQLHPAQEGTARLVRIAMEDSGYGSSLNVDQTPFEGEFGDGNKQDV